MQVLNAIVSFLSSAYGASATIAVVIEFVLHVVPSEKPLGILHAIAAVLNKLGEACSLGGKLIDKVLPQSIVPPSA